MHESVYKKIRPTGSLRSRLFGLPKVHKKEAPLRPILYMVGSSQHALEKYLAAVIHPVLQLYSNNCLKDSFAFAKEMQDVQMHQKKRFFAHWTFAVCSLMFLLWKQFKFVRMHCMALSSYLQTTRKKSSWN